MILRSPINETPISRLPQYTRRPPSESTLSDRMAGTGQEPVLHAVLSAGRVRMSECQGRNRHREVPSRQTVYPRIRVTPQLASPYGPRW
jgi:hypothetical protein